MICRRTVIMMGAAQLTMGLAPVSALARSGTGARSLAFNNLHTGEKDRVDYWVDGAYQPDALARIDHLLRDFRTGDVYPMDRRLLDMLYVLRRTIGTDREFELISGYRSPKTNSRLQQNSGGVATYSLHMLGMAADIRLPGINLKALHRSARHMRAGGVGFYPQSGFVHVDVGRVRYW